MKKVYGRPIFSPLLFAMGFITSCHAQTDPPVPPGNPPAAQTTARTNEPVAEYVVEIFEDSKGNLWFGTVGDGVARYDARLNDGVGQGKSLTYFSKKDGLPDNTVVSIVEDKQGNLWFGTHNGLSRYDGKTFTNFSEADGLCHFRVSNLLIDKTGTLWVGTWRGVCRYNGVGFSRFDVPVPDIDLPPYLTTMNWVTELLEDSRGNIWFARDGYGACRYDGHTFTHFTKKDGLASNNVQVIAEDRQGNIWFGSRVAENDHPDPAKRTGDGGVSRYDGQTIVQFPGVEGLGKNETYAIHVDRAGNVWIGANKLGVYRYDPSAEQAGREAFTLFKGTDRMDLTYNIGVQSILEDKNGVLWFGLSGGLFRLKGGAIVHVGQSGPWE